MSPTKASDWIGSWYHPPDFVTGGAATAPTVLHGTFSHWMRWAGGLSSAQVVLPSHIRNHDPRIP
jgi:hypothetical protein